MSATIRTEDERQTLEVGRALAPSLLPGDVILLTGDLGAGKTKLTAGIAQGLEVPDHVTSPTFNILLVHSGRIPLYHIDLYRLDSAEQLLDIDYWGTLEADGVAVVEWGDRFPEAMPPDCLVVTISMTGDTSRLLSLTAHGSRSRELEQSWIAACSSIPGVSLEEVSRA